MHTVLYIVNNLYSKKYGGRYFIRQVNEEVVFSSHRFMYRCDYIIQFTKGKEKPYYLKNRQRNNPYTEKELAWMLLKAKNYDTNNL